jgi:predicted dehydrogenase
MPLESNDSYGLPAGSSRKEVPAPEIAYLPMDPVSYRPRIGLIGCGGISVQHLRAYRKAGYEVAALCDTTLSKAREHQKLYYPDAMVCADWRDILARDDIPVLDITTHPDVRAGMFEQAIDAGRHILSQKPFVTDLDFGLGIVEKAEKKGVRLAVNQNGRWSPHWGWIRAAVAAGLLGEVASIRLAVNWDHSWISGSAFEEIRHLILYDFGIHWFDITTCIMGRKKPLRVFAAVRRSPAQTVKPPLLAQALIEYESGQASLFFDAATRSGEQDTTFVSGSRGSAHSVGPDLNTQEITLATAAGLARPRLSGQWFPDGFHGAMGELLRAIEQKREPSNGARENLRSLELCFAAAASADSGEPVVPGTVRRLPGSLPYGGRAAP